MSPIVGIKSILAACAASHAAGTNSANHFKGDIYDEAVLNLTIYFNYTFYTLSTIGDITCWKFWLY